MSQDTDKTKADEPTPSPQQHKQREPWRPRIDTQRVLHGFSNYNQEGDPLTQSPNITDPSDDSAPLQGSADRSDEDSVVSGQPSDNDENAATRKEPARARQAGTDSERSAERGPKKGG